MLGAFSMAKRKLWGGMIAFFRYLTTCTIEDGVGYEPPYLGQVNIERVQEVIVPYCTFTLWDN